MGEPDFKVAFFEDEESEVLKVPLDFPLDQQFHWAAIASSMDLPAIPPPFQMQKSVRCPCFLQFMHIVGERGGVGLGIEGLAGQ